MHHYPHLDMDRGGSFTEGELPDDMGDGLEEGNPHLRGWVPPDDRLWLHPSEIAKMRPTPLGLSPSGAPAPRRVGRRSQATAVAAAAVVVAVVLLVLVVDRLPGDAPGSLPADTTSLTTALVPAPAVAAVAARLGRSIVGLVVDRPGEQSMATGAAMAPGDLVVTAAAAVAGASGVTVVSSSGRRLAATVVGSDPTTGVAVIRVHGHLDAASFAEQVAAGQLAMTACMCDRRAVTTGHPSATIAVARVEAVGVRPVGTTDLLDAIEADHVRSAAWGAVLADGTGKVAGILDTRTSAGGQTLDVFVPGWLAADVAAKLATDHHVVHGWLGVTGSEAGGSCGALVQSVMPGTPAQSALVPGDVVVAVDGRPVCDWVELQATLYVMAPDEAVDLEVVGPSGPTTVAVALSPSPG